MGEAMKQFLYLIGIPGSGKTTLMREATAQLPLLGATSRPFKMIHYAGGVQLGGSDPFGYGGTDRLSLSVQKIAMEWARMTQCRAALAEGDRLANIGFFRCLKDAGWDLTVVYLKTSEAIAAQRRKLRGSEQAPAWLVGRTTKVWNLVQEWSIRNGHMITLDGSCTVQELTQELQKHPIFKELATEEHLA